MKTLWNDESDRNRILILIEIIIVAIYLLGPVPVVGHAQGRISGHSALAVLVPVTHTLVRQGIAADRSSKVVESYGRF
jgi:hypothetical protein